jgi:hypothetical protein
MKLCRWIVGLLRRQPSELVDHQDEYTDHREQQRQMSGRDFVDYTSPG